MQNNKISDKLTIKSRDIKVTPALKDYTIEKFSKVDKFSALITEIVVDFKVEKHDGFKQQGLSVIVFSNSDKVFYKEMFCENLYDAIDVIGDNMFRQIRKYKEKLAFINRHIERKEESQDNDYDVVKVKQFDLKPMFEEEAFLQMKMLKHGFFMFFDAVEERIRVIRKTDKDLKGYEEIVIFEDQSLTEQDAVALLRELDYEFIVYVDEDTENVRILYKRKDNAFGVIESI